MTGRINNRARMLRLGNRTDNNWLFLSLGVGHVGDDDVLPRAGPESGPIAGPHFFFPCTPSGEESPRSRVPVGSGEL